MILTDDGELLLECKIADIRALILPGFLFFLVRNDKISKNDVSRFLRFWKRKSRFPKQYLTHWRQN